MASNSSGQKVCIITGSSSGIGALAAKKMVNLGYHVIMACRDVPKAKIVEGQIKQETGKDHVETMLLDLSSLKSVRNFVDEFHKKKLPLHILVNNAGINTLRSPLQLSEDGFELTLATNHLGHFLLTTLLLDDLKKNRPSRIVVVASEVHEPGVGFGPGPDFKWTVEELNDPKNFNGMTAYRNSKLANVWFCYELSKRLEGTGVTCNVLNPGLIPETGLGRNAPYVLLLLFRYILYYFHPLARTLDHGANTIVDAATNLKWDNVTGKYFSDLAEVKSSDESHDMEKSKKLWELSELWTSKM